METIRKNAPSELPDEFYDRLDAEADKLDSYDDAWRKLAPEFGVAVPTTADLLGHAQTEEDTSALSGILEDIARAGYSSELRSQKYAIATAAARGRLAPDQVEKALAAYRARQNELTIRGEYPPDN